MTDIILNQLYPGGVMKQLADAAGGVVYDQYAAGGCVGQLYAAAGADVMLDQYAPGGPLHQIEEEIEEGEGGGGGEPDWVPANAVIHIDLQRAFNDEDAAWTAADGVVAVDTQLGSDANTASWWGTTAAYSSDDLVADGLTGEDSDPAIIGAALSTILANVTGRIVCVQHEAGSVGVSVALMSEDGAAAVQADLDWSDGGSQSLSIFTGGLTNGSISGIANGSEDVAGAKNVIAFTVTGTRFEAAVNGSDPVALVLDETDRPVGNPFVAAIIIPSTRNALQSITLYDALPSTAGLSELSEVS